MPNVYLWLVRAASWIVPTRLRPQWRAKWSSILGNAYVLYQRGELPRQDLLACSRACLSDSVWAWKSREQWRHFVRSPRFLLAAAAATLLLMGAVSHGFRATRELFRPFPIENPDRLVAIRYTGSVGQPYGVPPRLIPLWRAKSSLLADIAGYWHRPYVDHARVTTNFFTLLGAHPAYGRLFQPDDRDAAIVSETVWRSVYRADPRLLGSRITVEGARHTVIGILPESFWAISPRIRIWTPLQLEPEPDPRAPPLIGAIGRLKPGASSDTLRADLFRVARTAYPKLPRAPEIGLPSLPARQWFGYLFGLAFAFAVGSFLIARQQSLLLRQGWRYWRFLLSKTLLITAIPFLIWIETGISGVIATLLFMAACSFSVWWSFADQRERCPECLERLAMPVTIGSWSSVLEPVTTEFLCESGHGSLCVPETEQGERDHWTALDSSWRDLFDKVTPRSP
jgi:MacB-like periplasmic core domain